MKGKIFKKITLALLACSLSFLLVQCSSKDSPNVDNFSVNNHGFPNDFPIIQNSYDGNKPLFGEGGNSAKNKQEHQDEIASFGKNPVIFIHGNGGHYSNWTKEQGIGMPLKKFLLQQGYPQEAIWAFSYQGNSPTIPNGGNANQGLSPARDSIKEIREFIDAVLAYTGASKVDLIAHSLGCHMARGYALGLTKDAPYFEPSLRRLNKIGSMILISGANYGLGTVFWEEGSDWKSDGDLFKKGVQNNFTMFDEGVEVSPGTIHYYTIYAKYDYPQSTYITFGKGHPENPTNTSELAGSAGSFMIAPGYGNTFPYSEEDKGSYADFGLPYLDTNHVFQIIDPKIFEEHIYPNLNKNN